MRRRRSFHPGIIFLTCTLAVPTVAAMTGAWPGGTPTSEQAAPALATGALLGLAHLVLRPVLRVLFAPLGCLTLGLFGLVIDLGLLYACDRLVAGFRLTGFLGALLTALLINAICALAGGR